MTLVLRSIGDMIGHFAGNTHILINPTNSEGVANSGLAKAFAERWPEIYAEYRALCSSGDVSVGSLHVCEDPVTKSTVINLATKKDWRDMTFPESIELCCQGIVNYLNGHPFDTVAMPILGIGYSQSGPITIDPIIQRYLDPLPNIINLSVRPDRFKTPPLYLGVVGSRAYTDIDRIHLGVQDGLLMFNRSFSDFEGIVSGGAKGVDSIACGTGGKDNVSDTIARRAGLKPIVCLADWDRYGVSAGFLRNRTVADIGTHFVCFVGSKSVGTRGLIELVGRYNSKIDRLTEERMNQPVADIFDKPFVPLPQKKQIYICDISTVSV